MSDPHTFALRLYAKIDKGNGTRMHTSSRIRWRRYQFWATSGPRNRDLPQEAFILGRTVVILLERRFGPFIVNLSLPLCFAVCGF